MTSRPLAINSGFLARLEHSETALFVLGFLILVPVVLWWLAREGRKGTRKSLGQRRVVYPRSVRNFIRMGWIGVGILPALAAILGEIRSGESIILTACGVIAVMLPLHLEVHKFEITWDGYWIYTKSFWRRPRRIPVNSVTQCDYYHILQSYRIATRKNGIIRVPIFTKGIPELLAVLPINVPAYPPFLLPRRKPQQMS
ncbi:MAG: hypothetical protein V4726_08690 [Verrucomicrobiota bacterium]